ncbi:MAG: MFS transporter [Candidatus Acidiferrales bacterium]
MASPALSVGEVIDQRPLGGFQIWTIVLCGVVLTLDGYDGLVMGFTTTPIANSTHIALPAFGPILSASLLGLMIATLATGPIADRLGRKWVIIISELVFAIFTLLTGRAHTYEELLSYRFLTGLGLGGAMPNVVALASEYSPKRLVPVVVSILFAGMPLGGTACGVVARQLLATRGWRSVFYVGGVVPIVVALVLVLGLPESARFLAARKKDPHRIARILARVAPGYDPARVDFSKTTDEVARKGVPVKHLFTEGRAAGTLLLWIPNFMNLLLIYFINSWLPTLLKQAGMTLSQGVLAASVVSFGGIFACLLEGSLINAAGAFRVLLWEFLLASLSMVGVGFFMHPFPLALAVAFVMGFLVIGTQAGLNALAAKFYPTPIRSTGVGWALGVGRVGSVVGPIVGGLMIGAGWSPKEIIVSGAICGVLGWLAIWLSKFLRGVSTAYQAEPTLYGAALGPAAELNTRRSG